MTVSPTYDVDTQSWFLDTGHEAASLTALKLLLPKGTKIAGYYPKGYLHKIVYREPQKELLRTQITKPAQSVKTAISDPAHAQVAQRDISMVQNQELSTSSPTICKRVIPETTPKRRCIYDHDHILNLWFAGLDGPTIASELGLPRWTTVVNIVWQARQKGDPRATPRNSRTKKPVTLPDITI